jgi:hypothetical protein
VHTDIETEDVIIQVLYEQTKTGKLQKIFYFLFVLDPQAQYMEATLDSD